jgi:hypothetical protein
MLTCHGLLLSVSALRHSATADEPATLAAGLAIYEYGDFGTYCVNPPLVKLIASLPAFLAGVDVKVDPRQLSGSRPEFELGAAIVDHYRERSINYLMWGRLACIPFSLIGALVCFQWGSDLFGSRGGLAAAALWCFSPNILGHGALITPDIAGAAMGILAAWTFWRWLRSPTLHWAIVAGLTMGMAVVTKTTWIVLFGIWPLIWSLMILPRRTTGSQQAPIISSLAMLGLILTVALLLTNAIYGFRGSYTPLADYAFSSDWLSGRDTTADPPVFRGNRFRETVLGRIPIPLPADYVRGIDLQKRDFDLARWSYLRGAWSKEGWWCYYAYALAIKVPIGTLILSALATYTLFRSRPNSVTLTDALSLVIPALVVFLLVSTQTGINRHARYVFPCLPFLYVWCGGAFSRILTKGPFGQRLPAIALTAAIASSLWCYPHSLSFFNVLIAGPANGHYHLGHSNTDWGQDVIFLAEWIDAHPNARPLRVETYYNTDLSLYGGEVAGDRTVATADDRPSNQAHDSRWLAISVNTIHNRDGEWGYLTHIDPAARVAGAFHVYRLSDDDWQRSPSEGD